MKRQALVVGINRYPFYKDSHTSPAAHLKTAATDAEAVARILELYGNFEVKRLPSKSDVSQLDQTGLIRAEELQQAITELFNPQENIPNTALLYFAGHGWRNEYDNGETEGFLATSDLCPRRKRNYGVSLKWLRELLQNSCVQQQIVWLDCGYSGELFNFKEQEIGTGLTQIHEKTNHEGHEGHEVKRVSESSWVSPIGKQDRCWITATQASERANTIQGSGVLTQALVCSLEPNQHDAKQTTSVSIIKMIQERFRNKNVNQNPMFHRTGAPIILTGIRGTRWNYQHRLEHLWSETADWFTVDAGDDVVMKHNANKISNYFLGNSPDADQANSYKQNVENALNVNFPDSWWNNQESIETLHEALKCLCGAVFCGEVQSGRPISIGAAYLIALMAYAEVFSDETNLTHNIDLSILTDINAQLFPVQKPDIAKSTAKALYDLFFCLFTACETGESQFGQIFFNETGNRFTIEFTRGANETGQDGRLSLAQQLPQMLTEYSVPTPIELTNTKSAILRLWRYMLISQNGFMSPGVVYMERNQLFVASTR
jgi:hypothetical protein